VQPGVSWTAASVYAGPHYMTTKRLLSGQKRYEISNHLGNVLTTIGDRKIPVDGAVADNTAEYYTAVVHSAQDYYPFGMEMPGRSFQSGGYRYGFNGQEASDLGSGQLTAKFWEYDSRLGRRWNADPIFNTDISRFAAFGNNPNYFKDPNGDFKTKAGAKLYQLFHGGEILKTNSAEANGKHKNEYFVSKKVKNAEPGVAVTYERTFDWGRDKDKAVDNITRTSKFLKDHKTQIWNSPAARAIVPDYLALSFSTTASSAVYATGSFNLTLSFRGTEPGLYYNTSGGGGVNTTVGSDVGVSLNQGYYLTTKPQNVNISETLGGEEANAGLEVQVGIPVPGLSSAKLGVGLNATVGYGPDGRFGVVNSGATTFQAGVNVNLSISHPIPAWIDASYGKGEATNAKPIFKF
jgi:RHS repeat-associated protein